MKKSREKDHSIKRNHSSDKKVSGGLPHIGRPSHWSYAIASKKIGEALEELRKSDIDGAHKMAIEGSLHKAMTAAFKKDLNTARNALTAAFCQCTETLETSGTTGVISEIFHPPAALKKIDLLVIPADKKFYDSTSGKNLWSSIYFDLKTGKRGVNRLYGFEGIMAAMASRKLKMAKTSRFLEKIDLAINALDIRNLLENRGQLQYDEFMQLFNSYNAIAEHWRKSPLPSWWRNKFFPNAGASDHITNDDLVAQFVMAFMIRRALIRSAMKRKNYPEVETLLGEEDNMIWHFALRLTEMNVEIERETAEARRRLKDKDIWDNIKACLRDELVEDFVNSLDDWWGAKKYCVAAGCIAANTMVVIASVGTAFPAAVFGYVYCFYCGMMGATSATIIWDIVNCIISGNKKE